MFESAETDSQQKVCQSVADFSLSRIMMKIFDMGKSFK